MEQCLSWQKENRMEKGTDYITKQEHRKSLTLKNENHHLKLFQKCLSLLAERKTAECQQAMMSLMIKYMPLSSIIH